MYYYKSYDSIRAYEPSIKLLTYKSQIPNQIQIPDSAWMPKKVCECVKSELPPPYWSGRWLSICIPVLKQRWIRHVMILRYTCAINTCDFPTVPVRGGVFKSFYQFRGWCRVAPSKQSPGLLTTSDKYTVLYVVHFITTSKKNYWSTVCTFVISDWVKRIRNEYETKLNTLNGSLRGPLKLKPANRKISLAS